MIVQFDTEKFKEADWNERRMIADEISNLLLQFVKSLNADRYYCEKIDKGEAMFRKGVLPCGACLAEHNGTCSYPVRDNLEQIDFVFRDAFDSLRYLAESIAEKDAYLSKKFGIHLMNMENDYDSDAHYGIKNHLFKEIVE